MRLLKRLTVISLLMLPCCYASAQSANGESIVISENATELGKVDLSEVNRISFTEEALSVDKKDGTNERYSYKATVSFIDNSTDGIGKAEAVANNVRVYARENLIYIEGAEQGRVEVFALNGTQCLAVAQWSRPSVERTAEGHLCAEGGQRLLQVQEIRTACQSTSFWLRRHRRTTSLVPLFL